MNTKSSKQFWIDIGKDLIGFERGYVHTLRNVYSRPGEVVDSYFSDRGKYVSPFTLLSVSFSIYYLVSGFLVDWELVSGAVKTGYRALIDWQVDLMSNKSDEVKAASVAKVYNNMIVPMTNLVILGMSKYLIVIVLPIQIIVLFATSLFSKKFGFGFFHLLVSFNYFFSFSLLFISMIIIISIINVWLAIPCFIAYNYLFYGHFFKSFGDNKALIRKAFTKGSALGLGLIFLLSSIGGFAWSWISDK